MVTENTVQSTGELQAQQGQAAAREGMRAGPVFRPAVDIVETHAEFQVYADLPGVDEQHVDVRLADGVLSIDATLASAPDSAWTPVHTEYRTGSYHREFQLTESIDPEGIQARMLDGVLEVKLPKTDRHRRRQITVQAG